MQQIRQYFEKFTPLSDDDWHYFSSRLTRESFPKKSLLLRAGQTENHLSFIAEGLVRFYIPKDGDNDLTFSFSFSNDFVSAYDSFLTRQPSIYNVEALTDTVLLRVSHSDLQDIYQNTAAGNIIGRHAGEDLYLTLLRREISLLSESAEERYRKLLADQPRLVREIPLKYIASWIGITPQALSRIRKRVAGIS
ncbi:Crp/Fnr family transcriptional regulator [Chitinophaga sp. NPDC101104]|uniref:Crp/Fnr family transcriptional regulator n=1 Tax=Chitinophaga sp. NPDC101104 TaxID=3390561 RepID=UPI003CFC5568